MPRGRDPDPTPICPHAMVNGEMVTRGWDRHEEKGEGEKEKACAERGPGRCRLK